MPLDALTATVEDFTTYVGKGGFVMPLLVAATFVLWYALMLRFLALRRGAIRSVRALIRKHDEGRRRSINGVIDAAVQRGLAIVDGGVTDARRALDDAFGDFERQLKSGRVIIGSVSAAAPLAGLLGTVTGMIETFDSLGDMTLFSQTGGIAGGISQALFTTQMGLVVAVPGVVLGRLLDRRQERLETELMKLKDLLCVRASERKAQEAV